MAIPKIIHQTYKSPDPPPEYSRFRDGLTALHPGWEYRFYDDAACRQAVERHFPAFLPIYDRASVIQKTDIFRIAVVYGEGGFYADMDVECLNPLDGLCEFRCVFAEESTLTEEQALGLGHRDGLRVANYMFGSEPGHPLLLHILRRMARESRRDILTEDDVLESTGPGLITTVYHDCREKFRDVVLLPNIDRECPVCGVVTCHFGNYARHHHMGSWRWEDKKGSPEYAGGVRKKVSAEAAARVLRSIDSKIAKINIPDDIYVLRIYKEKPFDGLTAVYDRSSVIGTAVKDTKHLSNKKVLVSGMPPFFTGRLSKENINVVYTTFETTEIPRFWLEPINEHYARCIVSHEYVKGVFEASGVRVPVTVIQQGFTRYKRRFNVKPGSGVFRIGFLGVPYKRKNLFKLYQACVNLLGRIPGLRLSVHSAMYMKSIYTPEVVIMEHSPFVEWTWGEMSWEQTGEWYRSLSCYVFPSSGEGWSFTPRESMYLGIPTILSDIPVHREIIESGYCRAIPVCGKEDASYDGNTYGQWDRVSVNDIEEAVWDVYRNYGAYLVRALQGARWIENRWTNEGSQQQLLEYLRFL